MPQKSTPIISKKGETKIVDIKMMKKMGSWNICLLVRSTREGQIKDFR